MAGIFSCSIESSFKTDRVGMLFALMKLPEDVDSEAIKLKCWAPLLTLAGRQFSSHCTLIGIL